MLLSIIKNSQKFVPISIAFFAIKAYYKFLERKLIKVNSTAVYSLETRKFHVC